MNLTKTLLATCLLAATTLPLTAMAVEEEATPEQAAATTGAGFFDYRPTYNTYVTPPINPGIAALDTLSRWGGAVGGLYFLNDAAQRATSDSWQFRDGPAAGARKYDQYGSYTAPITNWYYSR